MSVPAKIEIRPIPNRGNIREFSKYLEYFSQAHIIAPFVDASKRKYKTGLSDEDIQFLKDNGFPYDITNVYTQGVAHPFWESNLIKVELKNSPMFLYPKESLLDFVKYKYLLVSEFIYKSESEMKSGVKPQATHFIYDEEEEITLKSTKLEKRNKLIKAVGDCSLAKKRQLVLIINNENTDNKNEDYLNVKLEEIIESDKRLILEDLLSNSKDDIEVLSVIKNAVRKTVLRKTKKGYFYFDTNLGLSESDVKEFLSKEENQEILLTIKDKIK